MSGAGALDRRISIEREVVTNTGTGLVRSWVPYGSFRASRKDASDAERALAGTVMSTVVSRFVVQSFERSRGIRPKDRLKEGRLLFEIIGVKEIGHRDRLEITAEARLD